MRRFIGSRIPPPPPPQKKKQEEIVVLVLVVYDRCRPRGGGGGVTPLYGLHRCAAGQGMVFYLPPCPPLGVDMLEMTTDAQEGNNKTLRGLIYTMQSHSVVKRFEITMIFY